MYDDLKKLQCEIDKYHSQDNIQYATQLIYAFVCNKFSNDYLTVAICNTTPTYAHFLMFFFREILILCYPLVPNIMSELLEISELQI